MKIAIVGAGFTGLSCALALLESGHEVTVFEAQEEPGGLAMSFNNNSTWQWPLEKFYHHIFSNDHAIIQLAHKINAPLIFSRPKTTSFISGKEKQLDSPLSVVCFDELSFFSRLRMGLGAALLKLIRDGTFLEKYTAHKVVPLLMGKESWDKIWSKLLSAKFGNFAYDVNMAWFWARVHKRTSTLGYFEGGFASLVNSLIIYIKKYGGTIIFHTPVKTILPSYNQVLVNGKAFDKVIITTPGPFLRDIVKTIYETNINYLWGQTLVLELHESLINSYWLNILESEWPFLVVAEHTQFIDKQYYNNKHIVYLGNYLIDGDQRLLMNAQELLALYMPYLKKINSRMAPHIVAAAFKFQMPFAQPVFPVHYSRSLPSIKTIHKNIYRATMSMVYPWDRGTNYAIELGQKAATTVLSKSDS